MRNEGCVARVRQTRKSALFSRVPVASGVPMCACHAERVVDACARCAQDGVEVVRTVMRNGVRRRVIHACREGSIQNRNGRRSPARSMRYLRSPRLNMASRCAMR